MGRADQFQPGTYNAICDRCGFKWKMCDLKKEWTGLMVCRFCYDPRHPQDLVRAKPETQITGEIRSEPSDSFLSPGDVTASDL